MASSSQKKCYPKRIRIPTGKAIANIINWVENVSEDTDILESDDLDEESSSSEEEEQENASEDEQPPTPADGSSTTMVPRMDIDEPLLDLDVEQDEEPDSPVKQKRGRPSISKKAAKKQSTTSTPPPVADEVDSQSDNWKEISGDNDTRNYNFRFVPDREPGVHADLDEGSTPLDCFFELFDDDIQDELVTFINEYAAQKLATVFPATKGSRFKSWTPMSKYEFLKLLAVITAMGIDKKPCLEDY